jgi:hypothetical protein
MFISGHIKITNSKIKGLLNAIKILRDKGVLVI